MDPFEKITLSGSITFSTNAPYPMNGLMLDPGLYRPETALFKNTLRLSEKYPLIVLLSLPLDKTFPSYSGKLVCANNSPGFISIIAPAPPIQPTFFAIVEIDSYI